MAIQTFPTTVPTPSYDLPSTTKPMVNRIQLGDGYSVRMPNGINNMQQSWNLRWSGLTTTEKNTIEAFFRARKGVEIFYWTPPNGGTQRKVRTDDWKVIEREPSTFDVEVTFTEELL